MKVPLFKPYLGAAEIKALTQIFKTGWIGLGPKTAEFEEKFADYIGTKKALGLNSCSAALHLAILAYNFPKGSEILVPTITFVSTAHAAVYNNCQPVFVDIDPETLCLDIKDAEQRITKKTKAIIPVHLGGQANNMKQVLALAKKYNLVVIEDAANACGGEWQGKKLGSWGNMGCFSFEAKKNITTGDGGMIVSDDIKKINYLRKIRWCGIDKDTWKRFSNQTQTKAYSWYYEVADLGFKYNMNDIQAAIGLVQLEKLDKINTKKRELIKKYLELLADCQLTKTPKCLDLQHGAYWLFIVHCQYRDALAAYLAKKGVTTSVHFMPIHLHPYYRQTNRRLPKAEKVWSEILSLPLFYSLTNQQINFVVEMIKEFEKNFKRKRKK